MNFLLFIPWTLSALHYLRGPSAPSTTSKDSRRASTRSMEVRGGPRRSVEVGGGPWRSLVIREGPWRFAEVHGGPQMVRGGLRRSMELQKMFEKINLKKIDKKFKIILKK